MYDDNNNIPFFTFQWNVILCYKTKQIDFSTSQKVLSLILAFLIAKKKRFKRNKMINRVIIIQIPTDTKSKQQQQQQPNTELNM